MRNVANIKIYQTFSILLIHKTHKLAEIFTINTTSSPSKKSLPLSFFTCMQKNTRIQMQHILMTEIHTSTSYEHFLSTFFLGNSSQFTKDVLRHNTSPHTHSSQATWLTAALDNDDMQLFHKNIYLKVKYSASYIVLYLTFYINLSKHFYGYSISLYWPFFFTTSKSSACW